MFFDTVLESICTDGAPSMLGHKLGFAARIKTVAPCVKTNHCVLHRYALARETSSNNLKYVSDTLVKIVRFIRGQSLNRRLF